MCRLDPGCERPEDRVFEFDPVARALERRAEYVAAALTVVRAYVVAGKPDVGLPPFGSFEKWSTLVRASLVWAGACDPCESREAVMSDDERKAAWKDAHPEERYAAIQAYNRLKNAGGNPVNPRQQASVPSWESNLNLAPSHTPSYRERLQSPQAPVEDGDTQAIEQDKGVPLEQHPGVISRVLSDYEDRGARAPLALTAGIPMAGGVLGGALGSALGGPLGMVVGGDLGATAGTVVAPYIPSPPEDSHGMYPDGDRDATPEEAAFYLRLDLEHIERAGLTFAEPGDPDAFLVKWKGRDRDRGRLESIPVVQEVPHGKHQGLARHLGDRG